MRKTLSWETYYDKVYGCFLGKCIGGTAGGPAEGRKELLDYPLDEALLHMVLPNDDLDLQILWLELIEEKGFSITARDMADEFYHKVPYGPGEYAYFQKNYAHGIYPPLSGSYNNRYYKNGMGCPIRSEIWACLFPGADETRRRYVEMDGSLDHEFDSIEAEVFLATLESELFFAPTGAGMEEVRRAVEVARADLPVDSKLTRMITDTLNWIEAGNSWQMVRGLILRHYGHADCTNLYQNIGFVLLVLFYAKEDFREIVRLGLACGYDTDCICATAASIMGILHGAKYLLETAGMTDTGLQIAIGTRRKTGSIADLAKDVCMLGLQTNQFADTVAITDAPAAKNPVPTNDRTPAISVRVEYRTHADVPEDPTISPLCPTELTLILTSHMQETAETDIVITPPEGISITPEQMRLSIRPGEVVYLACRAEVLPETEILWQTNIFTVTMTGAFGALTDTFGLVGCDMWYRYGPFLANNQDISHVPPQEFYGQHLKLEEGKTFMDVVREYHLGGIADIHRAFADETAPFTTVKPGDTHAAHLAAFLPEKIAIHEDLFDTAKIQAYEGPHIEYLCRTLISPEARTVEVAVGHTAPFALWINGKKIGESDQTKWWTLENMHYTVDLQEGENIVILKCAQQSDHAKYSIVWRGQDWAMRQHTDFGSKI